VLLPVLNSMAASSFGLPVDPLKVTDMGLAPVLVTTPFHISIDVVSAPEPVVVEATLDQTVTPPPLTFEMEPEPRGLEKSTIRSFRLTADTVGIVVTPLPLLFQLLTKLMATLVTWLAHELNTSCVESLGLADRHWPGAAWALGSLSRILVPGVEGAVIVTVLLLLPALNTSVPPATVDSPSVTPVEPFMDITLFPLLSNASKISAVPLVAACKIPATVPLTEAWTLKFACWVDVVLTMTDVPT
jgi:hypothetical protein